MMSKHLFRDLIRQDYRNRQWLAVLLFIVNLIAFPVLYLMQLGLSTNDPSMSAKEIAKAYTKVTAGFFDPAAFGILAALLAAAVAVTGFSFLASANKVDYYHALPIRREGLYASFFVSGWLMEIIPLVISVLLAAFVVGGIYGQVSGSMLASVARVLVISITGYTAVYAICILAMVVTGRILIGALLALMLLIYGPACSFLVHSLWSTFSTAYLTASLFGSPAWLSPLTLIVGRNTTAAALELIGYAAAAIVLGVLCYRKRPSETAGSAYMHKKMYPVIKVAAAIPASILVSYMMSGLQVGTFTTGASRIWAVVWGLITSLLFSAVMEMVQRLDFRETARHKVSSLIVLGSTVAVLILFAFRLVNYDTYLPKKDSITKMGIACNEINDVFFDFASGDSSNDPTMAKETMTDDFSDLYDLARLGVEESRENPDGAETEEDGSVSKYILIGYQKKSGRIAYRRFSVPEEEIIRVVDKMAKTESFRESAYPSEIRNVDQFKKITISDWRNYAIDSENRTLNLSPGDRAELAKALSEDIASSDASALREATPVLTLSGESDSYGPSDSYYIYDSYERTIAVLRKIGYELPAVKSPEELAQNMVYIEISIRDETTDGDTLYALRDADQMAELFRAVQRIRVDQSGDEIPLTMITKNGGMIYPYFRVRDQKAMDTLIAGAQIEQENNDLGI